MKDSGIDWLGQIPAHWEVKRLASFGKFSKGGGFSKSDFNKTGTDAVLYGDIYTQYDFVIDRPVRTISTAVASQSVAIYQGDLLFNGSGETREDIGRCVLFRGVEKAVSDGDFIIFRQIENDPLFLSFCLNSNGFVEKKAQSSKGEIIVHTYASALKNIFIPLPPVDEQSRIAKFIWDGIEKIKDAITIKQSQITTLKEYKTCLINAAVTGKIKVV
nr:restriction endonuclease subunit S [Ectothiorhodospira lacustris]